MVAKCEEELICDFAEIYRMYDYRVLPPHTAAVLACGLGKGSRTKLKLSGNKYTLSETIAMLIYDSVNTLVWFNSKDGQKNRNRPASLFQKLVCSHKTEQEEQSVRSFSSAEEFEQERQRIIDNSYTGEEA